MNRDIHARGWARRSVDHLVVTRRGGVVAIDSKWRNDPTDADMHRDPAAAMASARRASLVLRSIGRTDTVIPLVAVWGASRGAVPEGANVDGADFIDGGRLVARLRGQDRDPIDRETARRYLTELRQFKERVRPTSVAELGPTSGGSSWLKTSSKDDR